MKVRLLILVFIGFLAQACEYFKKAEDPESIANQTIEEIDWGDIDSYPLFDGCDETATMGFQKQCFESVLLNAFHNELTKHQFVVNEQFNETIRIHFSVDTVGMLQINTISASEVVKQQLPTLDSLIYRSMETLPKIYPALKRNQPVQTSFSVPLQISAKNEHALKPER